MVRLICEINSQNMHCMFETFQKYEVINVQFFSLQIGKSVKLLRCKTHEIQAVTKLQQKIKAPLKMTMTNQLTTVMDNLYEEQLGNAQ